jgi:hypothetical protein
VGIQLIDSQPAAVHVGIPLVAFEVGMLWREDQNAAIEG